MASKNLVEKSAPVENLSLNIDNQSEFDKKIKKLDVEDTLTPGTIYIAHLPHGFYEKEIRGYFSQFGTVNKVRLARSKKTGGHKGYGYVQFASDDVAKIAAETMDHYLMFDRILKCEFVPDERLHPKVWKGANKRFIWRNRPQKARNLHNKIKTEADIKKNSARLIKRDAARRKRLLSLGINYAFPGYSGAIKTVQKKRLTRKTKVKKCKDTTSLSKRGAQIKKKIKT